MFEGVAPSPTSAKPLFRFHAVTHVRPMIRLLFHTAIYGDNVLYA